MARKTFTTSIDEEIQKGFKEACSKNKVDMNDVLEPFMQDYIEGKFYIEKEVKLNLMRKKENSD